MFPYYSVNGGLVTVMSLTNHTDRVKAVRVRFLEAQNSRGVSDFNLYLSPYDQWTGALIDAGEAESPAILLSEDTSCIAPMRIWSIVRQPRVRSPRRKPHTALFPRQRWVPSQQPSR